MKRARFWYRYGLVFASFAIFVALPLAVLSHDWLWVGLDPVAGSAHLGLAWWWRGKILPAPREPSKHELTLREIDRLERELRIGAYAKSEAEFDAEVQAAIHPFRYRLVSTVTRLAVRKRSGSGRSTSAIVSDIGEAQSRLIRAMMGCDDDRG